MDESKAGFDDFHQDMLVMSEVMVVLMMVLIFPHHRGNH